ncbi:hypothetical protein C1H46_005256 [Malus baccata]|uniref:Uncharacterized protein n=1 Tax=Malus baccata TaxID=106549 RepID=A0A540NER0_MALBA|nr:hypothetical protein C1H46_005256 [Malus baccata]
MPEYMGEVFYDFRRGKSVLLILLVLSTPLLLYCFDTLLASVVAVRMKLDGSVGYGTLRI